jgi:hypothetical protein
LLVIDPLVCLRGKALHYAIRKSHVLELFFCPQGLMLVDQFSVMPVRTAQTMQNG